MNKLKTFIKVVATTLITFSALVIFMFSAAIASSSHNISDHSRGTAYVRGIAAIVIGTILIVGIWLPWKKIINR